MALRKMDKNKILEKRGQGYGANYKPWIKVHEFSSLGRAHRILGFKIRRVHTFLSDLELYYYLIVHRSDKTIDIREQFPLLPLEQTVEIAKELGIKHPSDKNQVGREYVMTTDFLITIKSGKGYKDIARTIKPRGKLDSRVKEKFRIEEEYWAEKGIDWGIVTDNQIDYWLGKNLEYLYQSYFWPEEMLISQTELSKLVQCFKDQFLKCNRELVKTIEKFDEINSWKKGESWKFVEYMILTKDIRTELKGEKFNYHNLKIDFD